MDALKRRLQAARRKQGINQLDFARKIEIPPSTYQNYEGGSNNIPHTVIISIVAALNLDIKWLFYGEIEEKEVKKEKDISFKTYKDGDDSVIKIVVAG